MKGLSKINRKINKKTFEMMKPLDRPSAQSICLCPKLLREMVYIRSENAYVGIFLHQKVTKWPITNRIKSFNYALMRCMRGVRGQANKKWLNVPFIDNGIRRFLHSVILNNLLCTSAKFITFALRSLYLLYTQTQLHYTPIF